VNEALLEDFAKAIIGQKSSLIGRFKVTKGPGAAR
jgi:hypothetical protein